MTKRHYQLSDVASALQKAIRRNEPRLAGYFAVEMFESGYGAYLFRRLLTISAEDCHGVITAEIEALYRSWEVINKQQKGKGRIFAAKATILLCEARKSRAADHLTNLVYDAKAFSDAEIEALLEESRKSTEPIPDFAFDCHTAVGKRAGKTKRDFFLEEQDALTPREPNIFDEDLEALRSGRRSLASEPERTMVDQSGRDRRKIAKLTGGR